MNANELADELIETAKFVDNISNNYQAVKEIKEAATMLRQQADRIAELEKQGKPVAWMQMHYKDNVPTKFSPVKVWEDDIPLYTTPQTKPLTDEEIKEVWLKRPANTAEDVVRFARAIEERHGIK